MKILSHAAIALAVSALLAGAAAASEGPLPPPAEPAASMPPPPKPVPPKQREHMAPVTPPPEPNLAAAASTNSGFATSSAFTASVAPSVSTGTALVGPVTLAYGGSAPAFKIADNGTKSAIEAILTNTVNPGSALFGQTYGYGPAISGYNSGSGLAGRFEINNPKSPQTGVFATTSGTGPTIVASITNANSNSAAIVGFTNAAFGTGIDAYGYFGITAHSPNGYSIYTTSNSGDAVYAESQDGAAVVASSATNQGVYAASTSSYGVYAASGTNYGVYAESQVGTGLYANSLGSGRGITAHSASGVGLYASSDSNYGIWGQSINSYGVVGEDSGSGVGVYGASGTGYAGLFAGTVGATSFVTTSDKNAKTNFRPIDRKEILARVSELPITSWDFKTDLNKRHMGPMAQDFHAAFGLDGNDDTHINLVDVAGVSLAAIQELNAQMKLKDEQIAELKGQLAEMKSLAEKVSARMTVLEQQRGGAVQTAALKR
jgi:Chaperone of endosialidase